jgi:hypothetical protein
MGQRLTIPDEYASEKKRLLEKGQKIMDEWDECEGGSF